MASTHDLADAFQLKSTTGWQTLLAILQTTGERTPLKRRREESINVDSGYGSAIPPRIDRSDSESEHLAKRIAGVRLNRYTHDDK